MSRTLPVPGLAGVQLQCVSLSSKPPPYSPFRGKPRPGDNIGLVITNPLNNQRVFYAPGLMEVSPPVFDAMVGADAVLVDGTFWTDDEMIRLGRKAREAERPKTKAKRARPRH